MTAVCASHLMQDSQTIFELEGRQNYREGTYSLFLWSSCVHPNEIFSGGVGRRLRGAVASRHGCSRLSWESERTMRQPCGEAPKESPKKNAKNRDTELTGDARAYVNEKSNRGIYYYFLIRMV
ncbi:hypothetical protein TNCT_546981 [Trichonephila clavata]|uniref:Uncharacterized protein n=1 Tax=Trichonephila clavata TaxID=2740835 RepID=A0A8X6K8Y1_TRICU|nr:hypothetical protein TNCT_546981 [Trichonephila clavata]